MGIRITLGEDEGGKPSFVGRGRSRTAGGRGPEVLALAEWGASARDALLIYVPDEPEIGMRFAYDGLTWEISDYLDGWIARLVVSDESTVPPPD